MGILTKYVVEIKHLEKWTFYNEEKMYENPFESILGSSCAKDFMIVFPEKKDGYPNDMDEKTMEFLNIRTKKLIIKNLTDQNRKPFPLKQEDAENAAEYIEELPDCYAVSYTLREIYKRCEIVEKKYQEFIGLEDKWRLMNEIASKLYISDDNIRLIISFD